MGQSQSQALPIFQCHPSYCFLRDIWCITYKKGDFLQFLGYHYNGSLGTRQPCLQESTGRHNLRSLPRQLHASAGPDGDEKSHSRVPCVPLAHSCFPVTAPCSPVLVFGLPCSREVITMAVFARQQAERDMEQGGRARPPYEP